MFELQIIIAFLVGLLVSGIAFLIIWRVMSKSRSEESRRQLEAAAQDGENRVREAKQEGEARLLACKEESDARMKDAIAMRDESHKAAMDALQTRFDETLAKMSAQLKNETSELLKAREKEFSESSSLKIGQLMDPLKENIAELRKAMDAGNKEQAERNGEMKERIRSLIEHSDAARKSADELAAAFKHGSKMQGDWGETILEELLSSQGLTNGVHFDTQSVLPGTSLRPDVILHLDERREVIIDSKVSLTAYVNYVNAENAIEKQEALKAHVDSIWKHVKELAAKDYSSLVKAPKVSAGYVIMFVPNAGALWTALDADPVLWRKAADMNVYIADEQSLYGALKMVSMTWTQVVQAQNHEKVYELAQEMIDRVGLFVEKYEAVGKALKRAADEYEDGMKKLEPNGQSIINTSRKLLKLGAKNGDKHPLKLLDE